MQPLIDKDSFPRRKIKEKTKTDRMNHFAGKSEKTRRGEKTYEKENA